jgi:RNA 2',3'-cyclic 3'-phosphodiesterase
MRVFVALELPDSVKDQLVVFQDSIRILYPVGNYSIRDNFHVTLKFIGEVDVVDLKGIIACMDQVAEDFTEFSVRLGGLGVFRKGSRGVVWSKVLDNRILYRLSLGLEECLVRSGYVREDRSFRPHVTLGRNILVDETGISNIVCDIISFRVGSICLMESKRVDGVLRYVPVYRVFFGGMRD